MFNDVFLNSRADINEARDFLEYLKTQGPIIGTDEAGRGALAGPVVAAAVYLTREQEEELLAHKLRDSKKLTQKSREKIFTLMNELGVLWSASHGSIDLIETRNVLRASLYAMAQSVNKLVSKLPSKPVCVIVDGNARIPEINLSQWTLVRADDLVPVVSAASIVAKVIRDRLMHNLDSKYPGYDFTKNKGYPTKMHIEKIKTHGICDIHRESFCRKFLLARIGVDK